MSYNVTDRFNLIQTSLALLRMTPQCHHQNTVQHDLWSFQIVTLPVSLSCHLVSIHQRALILFIQTLVLYKSFIYLLTYLSDTIDRFRETPLNLDWRNSHHQHWKSCRCKFWQVLSDHLANVHLVFIQK